MQAAPMKFYINKRPIPRSNNFIHTLNQVPTMTSADDVNFLFLFKSLNI